MSQTQKSSKSRPKPKIKCPFCGSYKVEQLSWVQLSNIEIPLVYTCPHTNTLVHVYAKIPSSGIIQQNFSIYNCKSCKHVFSVNAEGDSV